MTPALLALAAAALLVCVRADNSSGSVAVMYRDVRQDKIYHKQYERKPAIAFPSDLRAVYKSLGKSRSHIPKHSTEKSSEEDTVEIVPYERQYKSYYDVTQEDSRPRFPKTRRDKAYAGKKTKLPSSCLYGGQWHDDGTAVSTHEECLRCVCASGALSCRRRACAPLPDPLPPHCHVRHRRGFCCPELVCPDGVQLMEHGSARFDRQDMPPGSAVPTPTPAIARNACVEGGSVFAAGSALGSRVACEQCFCLRGARHCVRPSCLPPPPHCAPRPAPGACCPQRYYCDTSPDAPDDYTNRYDCQVDGTLVAEGSPVASNSNCSTCFCLRGEVRCQAMGCAPALGGCRPLLAEGECCAHQYICDHNEEEPHSRVTSGSTNSPVFLRYDKRTFHSSTPESTTKTMSGNLYASQHTSIASATKNHLVTSKVKRKTDEPPLNASMKPERSTNTTSINITTTQKPTSAAKLIAMPEFTPSEDSPGTTTEQPEGTVKIVINGTINCTAELSSTSLPLSVVVNDTDNTHLEVLPRVPMVDVEAQTYSPNDIITDRNVNGGFDEDDTFTINVTSSLMTNTSHSTSRPVMTAPKVPADLAEALNSSKKKKGEYDYDYTEPTLPPSLPNLKIIPFVAADAVVEDESAKDTYPVLEREDKFPVYYPSAGTKDTKYPMEREVYQPTQYPVFMLGNVEPSYPPMSHEVDIPRDSYPERNDLGVHEYTVSASLGGRGSDVKTVTVIPSTSSTFAVETPAVNRFSPPVETEGGFLPKGSGIVEEYFGVYPSTPSAPAVPHLTTSMRLDSIDVVKGECLVDGQSVPGGQSIILGCQLCTCSWVELTCEQRPCPPVMPPCRRLPQTNFSQDPCCGDVDCFLGKNTSSSSTANASTSAAEENKNKQTGIKVEVTNTTSESHAGVLIANNTATTNASNKDSATASQDNSESIQRTTTTAFPPTTHSKPTPKPTTTTLAPFKHVTADTSLEDEDDDDGTFSFGSVLKLLLSDGYETTTAPSKKLTKPPARPTTTAPPVRRLSTTAPSTNRPKAETSFKPLPSDPFIFNLMPTNTVNRIDHLVLGEATAITRTTHRPITNMTTKRTPPPSYDRSTSQMYDTMPTERTPVTHEKPVQFAPVAAAAPRPPSLGSMHGVGSGLLKVAGCNIYGRMYRVGRIIMELSTPCMECSCTEQGVQCNPLDC